MGKRNVEKFYITIRKNVDYRSAFKTILSSSKSRDECTNLIKTLFYYFKLTKYLEKNRSCLILEDLFHPAVFTSPEVLLQEIKFLKRLHVTRMISLGITREKKIKMKDIEYLVDLVWKRWKNANKKFNVSEFYIEFLFELATKLDFVNIVG